MLHSVSTKRSGILYAADVTVTAGATKGALADNGDNTYSMPITAPSSGTGTIAVSVAADVVTPGNNADSASFTYTEPAVPLGFGSETIAAQAWTVGTAVSVTLPEATGGTGTITYSLTPTTPAGVTFVAGTRVWQVTQRADLQAQRSRIRLPMAIATPLS